MAWMWLFLAGLLEIGWVVGLKYSQGFTRLVPSAWTLATLALSFVCLAQALRGIPLGTAYAVWTGIGAAGAALLGMVLFGESREPARLFALALIVAGIVCLRLVSPE